jgi:hypothetical protein
MTDPLHLCDLLGEAEVRAPSHQHVQLQYMEVAGEERLAIFQHPDSEVRIPLPSTFRGGRLWFAVGIRTQAWHKLQGQVSFRLDVDIGPEAGSLFEVELDPRSVPDHRTWIEAEVSVPRARALVLRTAVRGPDAYAWAGWADPVLEWEPPAPVARPRRNRLPHVFLITSDACRADLLGCYGNAEDPTPNLDLLARDGLLFRHARTNSLATPSSHASMISGHTPPGHGLLHEWGTFPSELPNLVTELARAGYRTLFAPSENEMARPDQGFAPLFADQLPLPANPAQDASVTTRQLLRWVKSAPDEPWFVWLAYFDTHPPHRAPPDLIRRFYPGDPRDPARTWRAEEVAMVPAIETLLELQVALPFLRRGEVDGRLYIRLRDTARALAGEIRSGPDLATHVQALGPQAWRGGTLSELARWLRRCVRGLREGHVNPELVTWLKEVVSLLGEAEREISVWLHGVVDYRYLPALVKASVAHLDRQVGRVLSFLRDEGLYEEATIIFTSPHGQLYGEGGHRFHHHHPLEPVLRVPLLLKGGLGSGLGTGTVDGVFQSIDLFPTLMDALWLPPPSCEGISRQNELRTGRPIPEGDIFAVDPEAVRAILSRPPFKLVKTRLPFVNGDSLQPPGSLELYEVGPHGESPIDDPPLALALEERLDRWLEGHSLAPTSVLGREGIRI